MIPRLLAFVGIVLFIGGLLCVPVSCAVGVDMGGEPIPQYEMRPRKKIATIGLVASGSACITGAILYYLSGRRKSDGT